MTDILQLLKDFNVSYKIEVDGWVNVNCPFHDNGIRGYKGGFNLVGNYYNCWNCGGKSLANVFSKLVSLEYYETIKLLEKYSNDTSTIIRNKKKIKHSEKVILPITELNEYGKKYLLKRNFDPDYILERYKVTGTCLTGEWSGRLIIPIYYKSQLVSFQGRSILSKNKCKELDILRYKTLSKEQSVIDPKTILYGIDDCKNDYLLLVEGPIDRWRIGNDCCSTLGTSVTPEQKKLISNRFKKVFIIFDPEEEAQQRARKLGIELATINNISVNIVNTELETDPGAMTENQVRSLRRRLHI